MTIYSLNPGKTALLFESTTRPAGTYSRLISLDSDTAIISIFVSNTPLTNSTIVNVYTVMDSNKELIVLSIPPIIGPTATPQIHLISEPILSTLRIEVITTQDSDFEIRVRGVSGSVGKSESGSLEEGDCNIIRDELIIENTGELIIFDGACLSLMNSTGGSRYTIIKAASTVEMY